MRTLILTLLIVFSLPAFAAEKKSPPWIDKIVGVPDPIPAGYNRCVRAVFTELGRQKVGFRIGKFDPPLSIKDIQVLNYGRRNKWAKLSLCDEEKS